MALPMNRVIEINQKAINAMMDYSDELKQALAKGDLMRVGELRTSVTWVQKIVAIANKPYVELLRGRIPDDLLRSLGIIDEEDS